MKAITRIASLGVLFSRFAMAQLDSDMGPAAFLWPTNRAYSAANDNTAPCGSAAGVTNRTDFPMSRFGFSFMDITVTDYDQQTVRYLSFFRTSLITSTWQSRIATVRTQFHNQLKY
jgi:hypothetical protein